MKKPSILPILVPVIILLLASLRARYLYYRDPTSCFFDPTRAYEKEYSAIRQIEADAFIETSATERFTRRESAKKPSAKPPLLCLGIPTATRPGGLIYVRTTIGSLLAGLDPRERDEIHLMPFIAHTDPSVHQIYAETWLRNVADQILTYNVSEQRLDELRILEGVKENREKQVYDYAYMLEACEKVGARYVATFEDDVLAMDGWFHRMKEGLMEVEERVKDKGKDFFYLRLFYTEQSLGWNSEFWPYYLFDSILTTSSILFLVHYLIPKIPPRFIPLQLQKNTPLLLTTALYCIMGIAFFFASGRVSMLPIPPSIFEMPKYGCCAQGLVYNPVQVPKLIEWMKEERLGYVDSLTEALADKGEVGTRWAISPSLVQHVGTFSTKGEDELKSGEVSVSQQRWNFGFEVLDDKALKEEHEEIKKNLKGDN